MSNQTIQGKPLNVPILLAVGAGFFAAYIDLTANHAPDYQWTVIFSCFIAGLTYVYLLPSVVAFSTSASPRWFILFLNLFLGVTVIGWLICMTWAMTAQRQHTIIHLSDEPAHNIFLRKQNR